MTPTGNIQGPPRYAHPGSPAPQTPSDWSELWKFLTQLQNLVRGVGNVVGTHDQRSSFPPNQYPNAYYYETDRTVTFQAVQQPDSTWEWVYSAGIYETTVLPIDLGADDAGFLAWDKTYNHLLAWDGAGWEWGPGESGSGYIQGFLEAPPAASGWVLCDGSNTHRLKSDGTTQAVTLPDLRTGSHFLEYGTVVGAAAGVGDTFTTAVTPTGTVSAPVFTGTPQTFTTTAVLAGVGVAAFTAPNPYTPAGTVAAPVFTGASDPVTGTCDGNGKPPAMVLLPYFRQ